MRRWRPSADAFSPVSAALVAATMHFFEFYTMMAEHHADILWLRNGGTLNQRQQKTSAAV